MTAIMQDLADSIAGLGTAIATSPAPKPRVAVLCYHHMQFVAWCEEHPEIAGELIGHERWANAFEVRCWNDAVGMKVTRIVRAGLWWQVPDVDSVMAYLEGRLGR